MQAANRLPFLLWLLAAAAAPASAQEAAPASAGADAAALLERWQPSLVTVKVVLKTKVIHPGGTEESESSEEIQGVVVDQSGLVMLSSATFSTLQEQQDPDEQFRVETTPSDFEVVFGTEDVEFPAFLAATDHKLGLAFVQVQDLQGREIAAVPFADAAAPAVGDPVIAFARLGKGYDHAPYFRTSVVAGRIVKPRKAWILDRAPAPDGLPVFTAGGAVAGAMVSVRAVDAEGGRGQGFHGLFGMLAGGEAITSFLMPGQVVHALIEQAKKQSAELRAGETSEKTEKSDAPEKKGRP